MRDGAVEDGAAGCGRRRGEAWVAQQRFDGFEQRLGLEHHALAAAKRAIVDGAMAVVSERAQVLHADVDEAGFAGPADDAVVERSRKKFREDGNDIKAHD